MPVFGIFGSPSEQPENPSDDGGQDGMSDVARWRYEQFLQLGFGEVCALLLAGSWADLGQARRLIAGGCDPALAFRILT